MPCTSPLEAFKGEGGKILFGPGPLRLPCGQCMGCRLERARQWAVRCVHESKLHSRNCFITLTYDDNHLPSPPNLNYSHFVLFMKRLRSSLRYRVEDLSCKRGWRYEYPVVRFYMCGEYGELNGRPHYHACIFGHDFEDRKVYRKGSSGFMCYESEMLSKLWPYGSAWCGDFSFETAGYCARYITKKLLGEAAKMAQFKVDKDTGEIYEQVFEFTQMSRDPGIGKPFYDRFVGDMYPHDRVVIRGKLSKPPRYYSRFYRKSNPVEWEKIVFDRSKLLVGNKEGTPVRRLARAIVIKARSDMLIRKEI